MVTVQVGITLNLKNLLVSSSMAPSLLTSKVKINEWVYFLHMLLSHVRSFSMPFTECS